MRSRLIRLTFRLPWHYALVRRVLLRPGEISLAESQFLGELVRGAPAGRPVIEIGTLFGSSTRIMALFKASETPLITVDSFRWNPHGLKRHHHAVITREILAEATQHNNVTLYQMDKAAFYAAYDGAAPGLVFLDANHSYDSTLQDIKWARSVGAEIICGHDHSPRFPEVMRAVADCGGAEKVVGSLFVMRKQAD